ncbi:MAG: hypothetical protein P8X62_00705 [Flavobacteriaceae bacterium]
MLERIEKADEEETNTDPTTPKKASRNLPNEVKRDSISKKNPLPKKKSSSQ